MTLPIPGGLLSVPHGSCCDSSNEQGGTVPSAARENQLWLWYLVYEDQLFFSGRSGTVFERDCTWH